MADGEQKAAIEVGVWGCPLDDAAGSSTRKLSSPQCAEEREEVRARMERLKRLLREQTTKQ